MAYWQLFYHAVWATKNRQPLITEQAEPLVHSLMRDKAVDLGGTVFAINGIANHVHLVVSIPPRIAVADFIGQVKGATSFRLNQRRSAMMGKFAWQEEYGVFSFDGKRLPPIVSYVESQKQHHSQNNLIPMLERWDEGKVANVRLREVEGSYFVADEQWWAEMMALSEM